MSRNRPPRDDGRGFRNHGRALAGGNVALALLGNTLPTGAILVVLILALGPISGAHFNPAVSLVMSLRKDHPRREFFPYAGAQIVGGCIGISCRARNVRVAVARSCGQSAHWPRAMVRRVRRHLRPYRHYSGGLALQERSDSGRGRSLHHGSLLVHRVHLLRQSRRHDRPRADEQLFRDRASRRTDVHRRTARRRVGGTRHHELVFRARCSQASGSALAVLDRQQRVRASDAVFPGRSGSPLSYASFATAPAKAGIDACTPHGWRSCFRDWFGDIGDVPRDLAEAALAHSLNATEGAYRRMTAVERRREVMTRYADWLNDERGRSSPSLPARPSDCLRSE